MSKTRIASVLLVVCMVLGGCASNTPQPTQMPLENEVPMLPEEIRTNEKGEPVIDVYVQDDGEVQQMTIEEYLCGVLAGEMKNDWPEEALKAQAILARTFVIKFLMEKESKYENADISTDINEAQAYDEAGINARIRSAVNDTRGRVLCYQGEPIYAWFHAHSGGITTTADEGLSYRDAAPYTHSAKGLEDDKAAADAATWSARFTQQQVLKAAKDAGVNVGESIASVSAGSRYESGRLESLMINGEAVPANEFRIAIGSSEMKSTLITELSYEGDILTLAGKGYGHGVGMSQWGAYSMAKNNKKAEEIIRHYFKGVEIVQMWK